MEHMLEFISNHLGLTAVWIILFIAIISTEILSKKQQATQLSPMEAVNYINTHNAQVFDMRASNIFKGSHIVNSINVTTQDFTHERMQKYKDKPCILVCAQGNLSKDLANNLKLKGFLQITNLSGGIQAWRDAGLPLVQK